jgi:HAMP domain-containing protein
MASPQKRRDVYSLPEGYGLAFRVQNGDTLAGYAHIVLADVSFAESIQRATGSLDQISQRLQATFVSVGAAAMIAALGIGLAVGALLSRPLIRMSAPAREFAAGNLSYTVEEGSKDEIGTLAAALNRMARDLWRSNRLLAEAQSVARLGSWMYDCASARFEWSEQCFVIFGVLRGAFVPELAGVAQRVVAEDRAAFLDAFEPGGPREGGGIRMEFRVVRFQRDERVVQCMAEWTQAGGKDQLMGTFQDITERNVSEDKLSWLANFDTLTGLPNRYLFKDRLSQAMLKAERLSQLRNFSATRRKPRRYAVQP